MCSSDLTVFVLVPDHQGAYPYPIENPLDGQREILVANNLSDTGRYQVRAHIRKVRISAVIIFKVVSGVFQAARDRRKFVRLFGIFPIKIFLCPNVQENGEHRITSYSNA